MSSKVEHILSEAMRAPGQPPELSRFAPTCKLLLVESLRSIFRMFEKQNIHNDVFAEVEKVAYEIQNKL